MVVDHINHDGMDNRRANLRAGGEEVSRRVRQPEFPGIRERLSVNPSGLGSSANSPDCRHKVGGQDQHKSVNNL